MCRIRRDGAEHHVGVSADIFGAGLNDEVDAMVERTEKKRGGPGIIHEHDRAFVVRGLRDRVDILNLEGKRAWRFQIDSTRVGLNQRGDLGADYWIVESCIDAKAWEDLLAEGPCRPVRGIGHEQMVAGFDDRQQRRGNCGESRRQESHAGASRAFEFHQRAFERFGGRRAEAAILIASAVGDDSLRRSDKSRSRRDRRED